MAKIPDGLLGHVSGGIGPLVGSKWKGLSVIRSRPPLKRRKSSESQLKQMAKMALVSSFVQPLSGFLNRYYPLTLNMSSFNRAISYNMRNAIDGDYPDFRISFTRVLLGVGDLLQVDMPLTVSELPGYLYFSWTDNSFTGSARATDRMFVAVYCGELKQWITKENGPSRNAFSYTLDVSAFSGKSVQTYIGFASDDAKYVTTSLYTGSVNIL